MNNSTNKPLKFIIIQVIILGITLLLAASYNTIQEIAILLIGHREPPIPFTIEGWNGPMTSKDGTFAGTRLRMVDDLVSQYDFQDWSVQELEKLLGRPLYEDKDNGKLLWKYDLRDGLNLLIFEIDDQQRVISYKIRRED